MGRQSSELGTTLEIKLCASDGGGRGGASANVIWTETGECSRVKVGGCGLDDNGVTPELSGNGRQKRPRLEDTRMSKVMDNSLQLNSMSHKLIRSG